MPELFDLGRLLITPTAQDELEPVAVVEALQRHALGDWGDLDPEDWEENQVSLQKGWRLLSSYTDSRGTRFWVITEASREATTVLLPADY